MLEEKQWQGRASGFPTTGSTHAGSVLNKQKTDEDAYVTDGKEGEGVVPRGRTARKGREITNMGRSTQASRPRRRASQVPLGGHADLWARMDVLMDKAEDIKLIVEGVSSRTDRVHDKLSTAIGEDRKVAQACERQREGSHHRAMTKRLTALEAKGKFSDDLIPQQQQQENAQSHRGWQPQHLLLGGWAGKRPKSQVDAAAAAWLQRQLHNVQGSVSQPYCPTKYGSIAELRGTRSGDLANLAFDITKAMGGSATGVPPSWCAVERSPDAGAARGEVKLAAEAAREVRSVPEHLDSECIRESGGRQGVGPCWRRSQASAGTRLARV